MRPRKRQYHCPKHISWIVEKNGVLLLDTANHRSKKLSSAEAALWDLLTRKRTKERLLAMIAAITQKTPDDAESYLDECLDSWLQDGWLSAGERQ